MMFHVFPVTVVSIDQLVALDLNDDTDAHCEAQNHTVQLTEFSF